MVVVVVVVVLVQQCLLARAPALSGLTEGR